MASKKNKTSEKKAPPKATTKPVRNGLDEAARKARARKTPKESGPKSKATKPASPLPSVAHAPPPPPPKAPPPPKTERKGKTTRVTFEDMDQVNYFAAKGLGDSFPLTAQEILAREAEVKRLLESLKVHREKLDGFTKDRDATKAKIDATPDGQRLTGLKESVKNSETIIAALQKKLEVSTWEVSYGRTFDAQRELFNDVDLEIRDTPRSAADRTIPLPLDESPASPMPPPPAPPPPAPSPLALPPVSAPLIVEGELIDEVVPHAADVQALLRQHGPLSIEALCTHLGWEERDSGNWQTLQAALRSLGAVKQGDGRWWYLPEHLRTLPAPAAPPSPPEAPVLALGPAPSLRDQLLAEIERCPGQPREALLAALGGDPGVFEETMERLLEQGAITEEEGGLALAPTSDLVLRSEVREVLLGLVEQTPCSQGMLVQRLCPPRSPELVRDVLRELVASGLLALADDETYQTARRRSPKDLPPTPPPVAPAKGHPQRVLRSWLWVRLCEAGGLSLNKIAALAPGYHREYLTGTLDLLLACELVFERGGAPLTFAAAELPEGHTVDQAVLDEVAGALADGGLTVEQLQEALKVPQSIVEDLLVELREQGRATAKKGTWSLAHQATVPDQGAAE